MTYNQIKSVALNHFTLNGYEGTSMADIAVDVGIKKQSIYTHFKGKDELFLHVCNDVFNTELQFVINYIDSNNSRPLREFLFDFLLQYRVRFEENTTAKFWLRNSFFPPSHLYEQVIEYVYLYLDKTEEYFLQIIKDAMEKEEINSTIGADRATNAYLGVLDGVFVELIYGDAERLMKRLDASWFLYWRGVSKE